MDFALDVMSLVVSSLECLVYFICVRCECVGLKDSHFITDEPLHLCCIAVPTKLVIL